MEKPWALLEKSHWSEGFPLTSPDTYFSLPTLTRETGQSEVTWRRLWEQKSQDLFILFIDTHCRQLFCLRERDKEVLGGPLRGLLSTF